MTSDIILAVDGCHGIHVPSRFFVKFPQFLDRLNDNEQEIISNPEHEHYWDVWDDFVRDFKVSNDGKNWRIMLSDGDVFFVSDDYKTEN